MAALEISPIKIGYVIVKAREVAAKVAAWDDGATSDHDANSILKSFSDDATRSELKSFIQDMNEDEQASLVALAWIGRGSFGPEELDEALETARTEHVNRGESISSACRSLPTISRKAWIGSAIRSRTSRTTFSRRCAPPSLLSIAAPRARETRGLAPGRTVSRSCRRKRQA